MTGCERCNGEFARNAEGMREIVPVVVARPKDSRWSRSLGGMALMPPGPHHPLFSEFFAETHKRWCRPCATQVAN